jgi:MFS family permease
MVALQSKIPGDHFVPGRPRWGSVLRRTVLASIVGNALEWYDFFLFGTAAALVFGELFFPLGGDASIHTLASFGGYAVGFLARPLGGLVFGHVGDRFGRKTALVWTLTIMGAATFSMGLLPTYRRVGLWAPILLVALRLVQGVAAGGEWSGGVLIITENAPPARRGFLGAWSQTGVGLGFVLAAMAFYVVRLLPPRDLMSWGWRIPFLSSAVIFVAGVAIRLGIPESAEYQAAETRAVVSKTPISDLLGRHSGELCTAVGARLAGRGTPRVWLLALIDIGTRAIIGYTLCLRREYGRYDVIRTLEKALAPAQRPPITIPELQPIKNGGFVSEIFPETTYACWRQIRFDNARADLAADSLDVACELLGCTVDVGPAYEPCAPFTDSDVERCTSTSNSHSTRSA